MNDKKIADQPHKWTIVLSSLALLISISSAALAYLSLNETRRNNNVNLNASKAYLSVTSLVLDGSLFGKSGWSNRWIQGFVTVSNTGRIAARNVETLFDMNPPRGSTWFNIARFSAIPPGVSRTVRISLNLDGKRHTTSIKEGDEFVVNVHLRFMDGVENDAQSETATFCLAKSSLRSEAISLYPCDVHFK